MPDVRSSTSGKKRPSDDNHPAPIHVKVRKDYLAKGTVVTHVEPGGVKLDVPQTQTPCTTSAAPEGVGFGRIMQVGQ